MGSQLVAQVMPFFRLIVRYLRFATKSTGYLWLSQALFGSIGLLVLAWPTRSLLLGEWSVGQWIVGVMSFQKMFGLYGIKHHKWRQVEMSPMLHGQRTNNKGR